MLISHRARFIYLKTKKTAGTSIEIALEPWCWPEGGYPGDRHATPEAVGPAGIVGTRMMGQRRTWYNHMPASEIRDLVPGAWESYLRFCAIRNPYDKVVSLFWWELDPARRLQLAQADFHEVMDAFTDFTGTSDLGIDRDKYQLDGAICVHRFIRYESLARDFRETCDQLGIVTPRLGTFKQEARLRPEPFAAYFGRQAAQAVAGAYAFEIDHFGYRLG